MRVLHINDSGVPVGGAETNLFSLMRLFREKGHEQFMFALRGSQAQNDDIRVFQGGGKASLLKKLSHNLIDPDLYGNRGVSAALEEYIREVSPDVIHLHNNFLYTNAILQTLKKMRVPTVQTVHDYGLVCPTFWCVKKDGADCEGGFGWKCVKAKCIWPKKYLREYLPRRRARRLRKTVVNTFICPSKLVEKTLKANGIGNTVNIPYFVFPDEFDPNPDRIVDGFILFVGVLFPHKGVKHLIEAMPEVIKGKQDAKLHIVGEGPDRNSLEKNVGKLGLSKSIVFQGRVESEKLRELYNQANFVVVPSVWKEQFGIVGLEAMASGRPVVGSNIGGIPEWLIDGKTGFLTKPGNSKDIAEKISWLLENQEKSLNFGRNGRHSVLKKYSPETIFPKLFEVYEEVVGGKYDQ